MECHPLPRARRLLAGVLAVAVSACSAAALAAALGRMPQPKGTGPETPAAVSARYRQFCSSCHGMNGRGFGPAAFDAARDAFVGELDLHRPADLSCPSVNSFTREQLEQVVRGGISCKEHGQVMPAFPNLTDAQFAEIADQLKAFGSNHGQHHGH